jgi:hypothetical protein
MTSKLLKASCRSNARCRTFDRRFFQCFAEDTHGGVIARELRFGGNGTLNCHFAEDAALPPVLQSKPTLVE